MVELPKDDKNPGTLKRSLLERGICDIGLKLALGSGIILVLADPGKYGTGKQVVLMNFLPQLLEKFPGYETYLG